MDWSGTVSKHKLGADGIVELIMVEPFLLGTVYTDHLPLGGKRERERERERKRERERELCFFNLPLGGKRERERERESVSSILTTCISMH